MTKAEYTLNIPKQEGTRIMEITCPHCEESFKSEVTASYPERRVTFQLDGEYKQIVRDESGKIVGTKTYPIDSHSKLVTHE